MMIDRHRVRALLWKERLELRGSLAPFVPGLLMFGVLVVPFAIAVGVPAVSGEAFDDPDLVEAVDAVREFWPAVAGLDRHAAIQAFLFQQFLMLLVLVPVSGAISLAAHGVVGEKHARTLEPLLATPVTPLELLLAKVLSALWPALVLEAVAAALYFAGIGWLASPGVLGALTTGRTALVLAGLGPIAALLALQLVVLASTRAKDPRTAQQVGVFVILPILVPVMAQGIGWWVSGTVVLTATAAGAALWLVLLCLSVALFDQERILTQWK